MAGRAAEKAAAAERAARGYVSVSISLPREGGRGTLTVTLYPSRGKYTDRRTWVTLDLDTQGWGGPRGAMEAAIYALTDALDAVDRGDDGAPAATLF